MEEYDDLSSGPNEEGIIDLSYNNWTEIPQDLYDMYRDRLKSLRMNNNKIIQVPKQIGKLALLKELSLSHNQLDLIDGAIGNCIRLRKLDVSHNNLVALPLALSNCRMLDTLILSDNKLEILPEHMAECKALELVDIRNNVLEYIPLNFSTIESLKAIDCTGNPTLSSMIPTEMHSDTKLVLWILRLHISYKAKIEEATDSYRIIEILAKEVEANKLSLQERLSMAQAEVLLAREDRPAKYIESKDKTIKFFKRCQERLKLWVGLGTEKAKGLLSKCKGRIQVEVRPSNINS